MNAQLGQLLGALKGSTSQFIKNIKPNLGTLGGKIGQTGLNVSKEMLKNPMLTGVGAATGVGGLGLAALLRMLQGQPEEMPEMEEEVTNLINRTRGRVM